MAEEKTYTQAELDAELQKIRDEETAKHNSLMADQRKKHDAEIAKIREDAKLSADELAQKQLKEQQEADAKELSDLRLYKKTAEIKDALSKEGLPAFLVNDSRLLGAKDEKELSSTIKTLKGEYASAQPKGANSGTNINVGSGKGGNSNTSHSNINELLLSNFEK